ncbi:gem-associated protein 2-like [Maniola jurtina]|uniref:gem-associated protein 2-like n=1 Tax=Maniola jurtina TaxID=191418 RepID=UPI001E688A34|nr:gem-associated protein 2-like [Maniola jurtina]
MSTNKCVYKSKGDDEDSDSLMAQCFPISSDVELKEFPTNGEEYLLKVIKEREKYAVVSKCNKDYSKFARNQSQFVKELPHAKAPDNLKPTIEWQNIQVADFSDVRMDISRLLNKKSTWPKNMKKINIDNNTVVGWENYFKNNDPTLSYVIGVPQAHLDKGLEILIEMLDKVTPGETIDHIIGQWIYAFLACTRQPLVSDTISILRDLARKCAEIRSHLSPEDENSKVAAAPLNLFICLVSRYFGQYDLAD